MGLTAQALIDRHAANLKEHQRIPTFEEMINKGVELPHILIMSCADPRCIPENIFDLQTGEAVVLRGAGGNAQYMLNSLLSIDTLLHFTEAIIVQHTDCGATMFRDAKVKEVLRQRAPDSEDIDSLTFGEITGSLADNVKKSMTFLQESPLVPEQVKSNLRGFVFDLSSGELAEVK